MPTNDSIQTLLGLPTEKGERWFSWEVSNGVAKFRVCRHVNSTGEVHVTLDTPKGSLLIHKVSDSLSFFRLMLALGIVDEEKCYTTGDGK